MTKSLIIIDVIPVYTVKTYKMQLLVIKYICFKFNTSCTFSVDVIKSVVKLYVVITIVVPNCSFRISKPGCPDVLWRNIC